jgi:hypothetical protein
MNNFLFDMVLFSFGMGVGSFQEAMWMEIEENITCCQLGGSK